MNNTYLILGILISTFVWVGCQPDENGDNSINIFTIEDDKLLGQQLAEEIANDKETYLILDENEYSEAYDHLYRIRDEILDSEDVIYKDEFEWETKIIHNDTVLNAFAGPAGYIYVYTGLIKFLDNETDFAGVLAHEIAHADRRHVTDNLTTNYGLSLVLGLIFGENENTLSEIAAGLAGLTFSRSKEKEADDFSVNYLCNSEWHANGASGFFEKLIEEGETGSLPAFLSTHPNPGNRVEDINTKATELMCADGDDFLNRYQQFKNSLP